jgi:hypothetical protein
LIPRAFGMMSIDLPTRTTGLEIEGEGSPSISDTIAGAPMPKISNVEKNAQATRVINGLSKHFAGERSYRVAGGRLTQRQMIAVFQAHIAAIRKSDAARAALAAAVQEERRLGLVATKLMQRLKLSVQGRFGHRRDVYGDFGWEVPRKPGPKTAAGKAAGVRKRAARPRS